MKDSEDIQRTRPLAGADGGDNKGGYGYAFLPSGQGGPLPRSDATIQPKPAQIMLAFGIREEQPHTAGVKERTVTIRVVVVNLHGQNGGALAKGHPNIIRHYGVIRPNRPGPLGIQAVDHSVAILYDLTMLLFGTQGVVVAPIQDHVMDVLFRVRVKEGGESNGVVLLIQVHVRRQFLQIEVGADEGVLRILSPVLSRHLHIRHSQINLLQSLGTGYDLWLTEEIGVEGPPVGAVKRKVVR
mmetsp:Transcript_25085/g.51100  ORF Transcript_25085/g.51100 Transcript_25085/m.51100 type:complete len:241 (+) Transcript_25085:1030-1752(+)